jgi:hypothetical protein
MFKAGKKENANLISYLATPILSEILLPYSTLSIASPVSFDVIETVYDHGPPLINNSPLYLQYNVFRI